MSAGKRRRLLAAPAAGEARFVQNHLAGDGSAYSPVESTHGVDSFQSESLFWSGQENLPGF